MKKTLLVSLVSIITFSSIFYSISQTAHAATIYITASSDTLSTFLSNVNSSLTNLNNAIGSSVTSITAGDGLLGGTITSTGTIYGQVGTSTIPTLGQVPYWTGLGTATSPAKLTSIATSTPSLAAYLSYSGTLGNFIGGSSGTLSISTLPIENGGTNAGSYTLSNGVVAYDGTRLVNYTGYTLTSLLLSATNATTTQLTSGGMNFYVDPVGHITAKDTVNGFTGALSPVHHLILSTGTTTTWTASTTGSAASPYAVTPFTGTVKQTQCTTYIGSSAGSFLGVNFLVNNSNITPSYFVASSTVGTETFTAGNTFTKGQTILMNAGTTTTATATAVSCTLDIVETP